MKKAIGFLAIAGLLIFASCSKDRTKEEEKKGTDYASTDDFYKDNALEEQSFVIDSVHGDTIRGKDGGKIWGIPKTIFMKKTTHEDIFYPYTLKLIEAYSIKNMILARLPNLAQGQLLQSGGEFKVTAFKNSDELVLKEHCGVNIMTPSKNPVTGMSVFYGFTTGTTSDWNIDVLQTGYLFSADDVSYVKIDTNDYGFISKIAKLGWCNIDKFFNNPNKTNITFTADGSNTNNIDVYIIFNSIHAFIKVNGLAIDNMPLNEPITVFALAKDTDGTMYYFKQDYTITSGLQVTLAMTSATSAEILAIMATL